MNTKTHMGAHPLKFAWAKEIKFNLKPGKKTPELSKPGGEIGRLETKGNTATPRNMFCGLSFSQVCLLFD